MDAKKTALRGKFIELDVYIKTKTSKKPKTLKSSHTNNFTVHG